MKEQDFMDALSGVQQDMLDELAEWQNAKTPVTGGLPEQGSPPAQNESPVLHTRRRNTMKQKNKQKAKIFRLSRWNIGIGAAVAAAVVAAVSISPKAVQHSFCIQLKMPSRGLNWSDKAANTAEIPAMALRIFARCWKTKKSIMIMM